MKLCNAFSSLVAVLWLTVSALACAEPVVFAVPGPGSLSYLPVYLAKALDADRTEGLELKLRYFSGGPLATRDLMTHNSDFLAVGLPAVAAARAMEDYLAWLTARAQP